MKRPFLIAAQLVMFPVVFVQAQAMPASERRPLPTPDPTSPPARHIQEQRAGVSFNVPAGWNFSRRDGDLSTFALDARSSLPHTQMQGVAQIAFNPFPFSTFSGALFYSSITPRSSALACSNQATAPGSHPVSTASIGGASFKHGYTEHGSVCTESRDEVYTALLGAVCYRFDLVINTFCGGEVSGARDMTDRELEAVRQRLETILNSVQLDETRQKANQTKLEPQPPAFSPE